MASYEEYAQKHRQAAGSNLDAGIDEAALEQRARQEEYALPKRFEGKSAEDIARSYEELEKLSSKQSQDVGIYRQLVDQLVNQQSSQPDPSNEVKPITIDDLYDNPEEAVRKAVDSHPTLERMRELEKELMRTKLDTEKAAFLEKHADAQDVLNSPDFQDWVKQDPFRVNLFKQADGYDFGAADAMLKLYKGDKSPSPRSRQDRANSQLLDASLETGGRSEPAAAAKYSRSEMLEKMIAAKSGDDKAQRYLNAHMPAYRKALSTGNVKD